jgi:hypothetical protein
MKYLKPINFKVHLFEDYISEALNTQGIEWVDYIQDMLDFVTNDRQKQKLESLILKDILNSFYHIFKNEFIEDFKKKYNTLKPIDKVNFLQKEYKQKVSTYYNNILPSIIDYLTDPTTTNPFDNVNTLVDLSAKSIQWHEDIARKAEEGRDDDTEAIRKDETSETDKFITYPNGWYWINLNVEYSEDEANNMGHCGKDPGKILFSLRDDKSNSHITVSYKESEKAMYQCKGRGNSKPKSEYHKYILDMILNNTYPVNLLLTGSYRSDLDFNLMDISEEERNYLIAKKPSLEYTDNIFESYLNNKDFVKIISMINNGFVYNGYVNIQPSIIEEIIEFKKVDKTFNEYDLLKAILQPTQVYNYYIHKQDYEGVYQLLKRNVKGNVGVSKARVKDFYEYMSSKGVKYIDYVKNYKELFNNDYLSYEVADIVENKDYDYFMSLYTDSYCNENLLSIFEEGNTLMKKGNKKLESFLIEFYKKLLNENSAYISLFGNFLFELDENAINELYLLDKENMVLIIQRCFIYRQIRFIDYLDMSKKIAIIIIESYLSKIEDDYVEMLKTDAKNNNLSATHKVFKSLHSLACAKKIAIKYNYENIDLDKKLKEINTLFDEILNTELENQSEKEIIYLYHLLSIINENKYIFVIIVGIDKLNQFLNHIIDGSKEGSSINIDLRYEHQYNYEMAHKILSKNK